jgi:hypothetical protein
MDLSAQLHPDFASLHPGCETTISLGAPSSTAPELFMTSASMERTMPSHVASPGAARPLAAVVIAAGMLLSSAQIVAAQTDIERQAQCELSAIRDTRSALAVQYIRSACNWLVVNRDSLLNASSRGYYVCLVQQLSGAQSNEAAAAILSACRASYPP